MNFRAVAFEKKRRKNYLKVFRLKRLQNEDLHVYEGYIKSF